MQEHIVTNFGVEIDTEIWRRILKEKLGYSFKKWSPRPLNLNYQIQKLKKMLFSIKLLKIFRKSWILVNIDESVISNSTKSNYSWSRKGVPTNLSTITMKGSISIVTAILSNGVSITGIRYGTIKSSSFIEYINHLLAIWRKL